MKTQIIALATLVMISWCAQAHQFHSENVCSTQIQGLCVHLGYNSEPVINQSAEFMVHFESQTGLDMQKIESVSIDLWMPDHGHGSSPVQVRRLNSDHFLLSDAWFVMPGLWQIRINVSFDGQQDQLLVPIEILK